MLFDTNTSNIFGAATMKLESKLKNPNQYRDAVLFEALNSLPVSKKKEFINSKEAKFMIENELISAEVLDRLESELNDCGLKTTVCHMAKENGDPMWDSLVRCRIEERRIMNDLMEKYSAEAKSIAENANKDFVEKSIPEYFRK